MIYVSCRTSLHDSPIKDCKIRGSYTSESWLAEIKNIAHWLINFTLVKVLGQTDGLITQLLNTFENVKLLVTYVHHLLIFTAFALTRSSSDLQREDTWFHTLAYSLRILTTTSQIIFLADTLRTLLSTSSLIDVCSVKIYYSF